MPTVNLSFDVTANQVAKLQRVLTAVNAERAAQEQSPFATFADYATEVIKNAAIDWLRILKEQDKVARGTAWAEADDATQAQVDALLGL